jgi:hypothetical protein
LDAASDTHLPLKGCRVFDVQPLFQEGKVRVCTAFNRLLGLPGASVRAVLF